MNTDKGRPNAETQRTQSVSLTSVRSLRLCGEKTRGGRDAHGPALTGTRQEAGGTPAFQHSSELSSSFLGARRGHGRLR